MVSFGGVFHFLRMGWDESNRGVPVYPLLFITGLFQVVIHQQLGYTFKSGGGVIFLV